MNALVHFCMTRKGLLKLGNYEEKRFNWVMVLQNIQAWCQHSTQLLGRPQERLLMVEIEVGAGTSHGKSMRELRGWCHTL